jgi:hypothetical protein
MPDLEKNYKNGLETIVFGTPTEPRTALIPPIQLENLGFMGHLLGKTHR